MNKKLLFFVVIALSIAILIIAVINANTNTSFWKVTISECAGLLIGVWISFFIVERQTDKRKQKDLFIELLESLKYLIEEKSSYDFTNVSQADMLMRMRQIGLKIDLIAKYSKKFSVENFVDTLNEKYQEYQSVIDNHSTDLELLKNLQPDLHRPLNLMSQKITETILSLFD